ncbi:SNF2-related protein [Thiopseudomonas denitrificans]
MHPQLFTPGSRIEVRDAEWRIKRIDRTTDGGEALVCEGLSELVLGRETTFLSKLEPRIRVLEPQDTRLVDDPSSQYRASRLYLDTLIRNSVPTDDRIYAGQHAALDLLPYQFEPARQALRQPRQRILIADTVGLGKTLEAGILVSELIARGKGKRILVLAVKAMLTQFQQEFWNRFSIGLTRLDSQGLQRVRNRIPANHNPFHHFDRAIISIDTLKQDIEYRHYLEQAYWDIIIIDEAHNVAERGSRSQRARLAKLLATRSDTLVMLTATPHDGKPESFASLVNMLDPTAIANPSDYQSNDYRDKGLVIRRFKADVRDQLSTSFPDRDIATLKVQASPAEEALYEALATSSFQTLKGTGAGQLFRTTLMKALFSSPAALLSTLDNRLQRLANRQEKTSDPQLQQQIDHDIEQLEELRHHCVLIDQASFSKYQLLVDTLINGSWDASQPDDRLVIFTESIPTLEFLQQHLPKTCKLKKDQVALLRGDMSDRELADTVNSFNQLQSPLRLLLCSDVASEGINLHHLSHRMIHFDIPWSLMVFQQRNGRIDRYGQTRQPLIRYLLTDSQHPKIQGDTRILEVLINKDAQAGKNIGDPSEFNKEEGEARTAAAMEAELLNPAADPASIPAMPDMQDIDWASFFKPDNQASQSPASDLLAAFTPDTPANSDDHLATRQRLFDNDFDYARKTATGLPGGAYRRIGSTDQRCVDEDLWALRGSSQPLHGPDSTILQDARMDDFDPQAIAEYRRKRATVNAQAEELAYSDTELLEALGALRYDNDQLRPTLAGILLFGKPMALRRMLPMAKIDYIRVPGVEWIEDPHDRFQSIEIRKPLVLALPQAEASVIDELPRGFHLPDDSPYSVQEPIVPRKVVREAIANAVMHRTYLKHSPIQIIRYSNRIEFRNIGHSIKPEDQLGRPGSWPRNPLLGAVLHDLNLAEAKGSGIRTMRRLSADADLSPPEFKSDRQGDSFCVTVFLHNLLSEDDHAWLRTLTSEPLDDEETKVLIYARATGAVDNSACRDFSGMDTLTASRVLRRLRDRGLLEKHGAGNRTYYSLLALSTDVIPPSSGHGSNEYPPPNSGGLSESPQAWPQIPPACSKNC